jgi:hypothetical protein
VYNVTLLGRASVCGATTYACRSHFPIIVLTPPHLSSVGTMVVAVPRLHEAALRFFNASFSLSLKNSERGQGFSLSYTSRGNQALHHVGNSIGLYSHVRCLRFLTDVPDPAWPGLA